LGGSDKFNYIGKNNSVNYSRYPYEVLYDEEGVCGACLYQEQVDKIDWNEREKEFVISPV